MMSTLSTHHLLKLLIFLTVLHHLPPQFSSASTPVFPKEALPTRSGYLKVNPTTGSAMYYAFYEAQQHNKSSLSQTPLLFWLQGGPGCSSMLGNFFELGPWRVSPSSPNGTVELKPNPGPWNRIFGLAFLDNPIGAGFSIAGSKQEIPNNQQDVAKHLWIAIQEFIALDPSFKTRPIYLTGESYAGKYIPAIGYYILKKNAQLPKSKQVNLHGVAIGNGLTDPATQVATHAINARYIGLINEKQRRELEILESNAVRLTKSAKWNEATNARNKVLDTLTNMTGLSTLYDYTRIKPYETPLVDKLLSYVEIKRLLGAKESIIFDRCSDLVADILHDDVMKSTKTMMEFLVKNTKVLLYQGSSDLRDGVISTEAWIKKMRWAEIRNFLNAERKVWEVNDKLAGYVQRWDKFFHVVILNAGHLVPYHQPVNSQAMIEDWVLEKKLFGSEKINSV